MTHHDATSAARFAVPEDRIEAQTNLELDALEMGRRRFLGAFGKDADREGLGNSGIVRPLLAASVPDVADALEAILDGFTNKAPRARQPAAIGALQGFELNHAAVAGLACALSSAATAEPLALLSERVGQLIENETWLDACRAADAAAAERIATRAARNGASTSRRKAIKAMAGKAGFTWEEWDRPKRARVGSFVINAVLKACPDIFEVHRLRDQRVIRFTADAARMIARNIETVSWCQPTYQPMVVPPRPWDGMDTGAYLTERMARTVKLVRTRNREHRRELKPSLASDRAAPLRDAVNAIQATPWRINPVMLDIVEAMVDHPVPNSDMPGRAVSAPPRPEGWDTLAPDLRKAWRIEAARTTQINREIAGQRVVFAQDVATARAMLANGNRFWIPHNLDFRGRVYPVPHFNPQRGDSVRCLFDFADGVALGADGLYWLAVHLANCGDFDKVSKKPFGDRVRWVDDHLDDIIGIARDPLGRMACWTGADAPFQFLRACQEYAAAITSPDPAGFVSHLPVALDGSCSGLQHYAASLRDRAGAQLVNLVPTDRPGDIYAAVAAAVGLRIDADLTHDDAETRSMAALWSGRIERATVKRSVMTFAYSSEEFGFRQQIMEDTMRPLSRRLSLGELAEHPYGADGGWKAAGYLARLVWQAVNEVVSGAGAGMAFFKSVAGLLAHEAKRLSWITPLGLEVIHEYPEWDHKEIDLYFLNTTVRVAEMGPRDKAVDGSVYSRVHALLRTTPTTRLDKAKQKSAVAPNVIHSMDASHLLMTVLEAARRGIGHYALIHDSFGTHAGNTTRWSVLIRETMVQLYEGFDPYRAILDAAQAAISDEGRARLPPLPARGTLNLRDIISAEYAFA